LETIKTWRNCTPKTPVTDARVQKMSLKTANTEEELEDGQQLIVGLFGISTTQYPCLKYNDDDKDALVDLLRKIRAAHFDIVGMLETSHKDRIADYKVSASLEYE
jgi:hypothetical protein